MTLIPNNNINWPLRLKKIIQKKILILFLFLCMRFKIEFQFSWIYAAEMFRYFKLKIAMQ